MTRNNSLDLGHFLHIKKHKYKKQRKQLQQLSRENAFQIDANKKVTDRSIFKYWKNREKLFSQINTSNIHLTRELWFSVTPELIAKFTARFVRTCLPEAKVIMDVFCGGGGNSIQFAMYFPKVYGIDYSMEHLYCTYKNSQAYQVDDRLWLKYGSWHKISKAGKFKKLKIDCVFASPPWGGPNYLRQDVFDLERGLEPMGLKEMLESFLEISDNVIMFLPRNSDLRQVSRVTRELLGSQAKCKVLYVNQDAHLKGILCFWGEPFYKYRADSVEVDVADEGSEAIGEGERKPQNENFDEIALNYDIDG